jgi:hypothetical protein
MLQPIVLRLLPWLSRAARVQKTSAVSPAPESERCIAHCGPPVRIATDIEAKVNIDDVHGRVDLDAGSIWMIGPLP